jgi:thiamine biosynthesis lipoprotein
MDQIERAASVLRWADAEFSLWIEDSPINQLRSGETEWGELPAHFVDVVRLCEEARDLSRGWFDPWSMPGGFDPTGIVKGWALERAFTEFISDGVTAAVINGGGDIVTFASPPGQNSWRIGIQHPWKPESFAAILRVNGAIATSGTYERGPHLIDPRTGEPSSATRSATVTGPQLSIADALATAVAVGGRPAIDAIDAISGYEAYVIFPDGTEVATPGIVFDEETTDHRASSD